jgi:hypothetical protein
LREPEYTHSVRVALHHNDVLSWDRICTDAIELFGLPGQRYITDLGGNSMDWIFRDSRDAVLFKLKFGEVVC